jgi:hypothetical protein
LGFRTENGLKRERDLTTGALEGTGEGCCGGLTWDCGDSEEGVRGEARDDWETAVCKPVTRDDGGCRGVGVAEARSTGVAVLGSGGVGRRRDASWGFGIREGVGVRSREGIGGRERDSSETLGVGGPV